MPPSPILRTTSYLPPTLSPTFGNCGLPKAKPGAARMCTSEEPADSYSGAFESPGVVPRLRELAPVMIGLLESGYGHHSRFGSVFHSGSTGESLTPAR